MMQARTSGAGVLEFGNLFRMDAAFSVLVPLSLFVVFVVLCGGVFALFRGGDFGRSWSNRMMRLRVLAQFVAVLILMGALWWSQGRAG
jgi:hypothetical protein